jgi:hypothetical protein
MNQDAWDPAMAAYVDTIIQRTPDRAVLQFNRADFRLPWLRQTFPDALLVHLFRHPRDQWCSSLVDLRACPPAMDMAAFRERDHYYLLTWASDLKYQFPFLDPATIEHPYRLFYFIWKLSYWYGTAFADYSLSFEALTASPQQELERLMTYVGLDTNTVGELARLVEPAAPRWPRYAGDGWFREHEEACEEVLQAFFRRTGIPQHPARTQTRQEASRMVRMVPAR